MAMSGDTLGDELKAAIDAAVAANPTLDDAQRTAIWRAIGGAIVAHIATNAQLTFRTTDAAIQTSTSPGSPTAGPAAAVQLLPGQVS